MKKEVSPVSAPAPSRSASPTSQAVAGENSVLAPGARPGASGKVVAVIPLARGEAHIRNEAKGCSQPRATHGAWRSTPSSVVTPSRHIASTPPTIPCCGPPVARRAPLGPPSSGRARVSGVKRVMESA